MELTLVRYSDDGKRTRGVLFYKGNLVHTLEEPWKNNLKGQSCIPVGVYKIVPHGWEENTTLRQKKCWEITSVPGRGAILIHSGNTVDDIEGCILVGFTTGVLHQKAAVLDSKRAMSSLRFVLGEAEHTLKIIEVK